jgi:hypothetical protein
MSEPASNEDAGRLLRVTFNLPEKALPGSLTLTFTGPTTEVLTLNSAQGVAGLHSFILDASNPTSGAEIANGTGIPEGTYAVTLSYRDEAANPQAMSVPATNVQIRYGALDVALPNLQAIAVGSSGGLVHFPEAAVTNAVGAVQLTYSHASGSTFPNGVTHVTVTATDEAGQTSADTFTISVLGVGISTPTANATIKESAKGVKFEGTAGETVTGVELSINGRSALPAELATNTGVRKWTLITSAVEAGTNTVVATATDGALLVSSAMRSFFHEAPRPLALTIEPVGAGTLTFSPPLISGGKAGGGKTYAVTAKASQGYLFDSWSGRLSGTAATASFTFAEGDAVNALFLANPFAAISGGGTSFHGLIHPIGGSDRSAATEGFLTATLTAPSGALSGKVLINGFTQSFTGMVYGRGAVWLKSGGVLTPTLTFGTRTLTLSYNAGTGNDEFSISLSNSADGSTCEGTARRAIYSSTRLVTASFPGLINTPGATAASGKGLYTVAFPAAVQSPSKSASEYPQGDGFATLTLSNTGAVTVRGTLADGTTLTGTSALVAGNHCPIYGQLVTPGAAASVKGGVLLGTLVFDGTQPDTDVVGSDLLWFRPAVTELSGTTTTAMATQRYTDGWPAGISLDAVGALYEKNTHVQAALQLGMTEADGNGKLVFDGGRLSGSVTVTAFNVAPGATIGTSTVAKIPATNATFTLSFVQRTGTMSGTFTPNWANPAVAKTAFKGILIQKGPVYKGGYGYFLSNIVGDSDPESGRVTLGKQP